MFTVCFRGNPVNKTQLRSLEFTLNRVIMKVFRTTSMDVIAECRYWFGLLEMETLIARASRGLWPNTFSLTTYYVNCSLMLRMCNVWQLRHYCFFSFFLCIYCIYSSLVCCQLTWWIKLTNSPRKTFRSGFCRNCWLTANVASSVVSVVFFYISVFVHQVPGQRWATCLPQLSSDVYTVCVKGQSRGCPRR